MTTAHADIVDQVSLHYYPPGSVSHRYKGPQGAIVKGIQKYFKDVWEDTYIDLYENDKIDFFELQKKLTFINNEMSDHASRGKWWDRRWWDSLLEEKGGAPETPLQVSTGRTIILLDTGIFYITSDFKFKIRELQGTIDYRANTLNIGSDSAFSGYGWKFKFTPKVKFGTSRIEKNFKNILRSVSVELTLTHYNMWHPYIKFVLRAQYTTRHNEGTLSLLVDLPMWYRS